ASYLQGITCVRCNLKFKPTYILPCLLHNFSSYDSKFVINYLKKYQDAKYRVELLAKSSEKFISIRIGSLEFKDSMSFLSGSLDACSSILKDDQYRLMRRLYPNQDQLELMKHKIPF